MESIEFTFYIDLLDLKACLHLQFLLRFLAMDENE
jgi:hypothetical protein